MRQFKRGTSRQELNISWLKKNELELKRHVAELRDSVRSNWSTTGQELTKELRQFWQNSRPVSPVGFGRVNRIEDQGTTEPFEGIKSPSALSRLPHLDIPRTESPGRGPSNDFATGYSLGLLGGVKSWVCVYSFGLRIVLTCSRCRILGSLCGLANLLVPIVRMIALTLEA